MKILAVLTRTKTFDGATRLSAVEWWRVKAPLLALAKQTGWTVDFVESLTDFTILKNYDLVWLSYMDNILGFKALVDSGVPFVIDFDDDFFNLGQMNPVRKEYPPGSLAMRSITHIIQHAPHLTVSTDHLKRVYDKYRVGSSPCVVLENRITPEAYKEKQAVFNTGKPLTIGWMGGATHYGDLFQSSFWGALCFIAGKYQNIVFSVMGLYPDAEYRELPNCVWTEGSSDHPTFTKLMRKWMNTIDICVAPLEDTLFNASKSSIKCQEYGVYGKPVVASSVRPYQEFNADSDGLVALCDTHAEWVKALEALISDRRKREVEGKKLYEFVNKKYTIESVVPEYKKYIESVVQGKNYSSVARQTPRKGRLHIALANSRFNSTTGSELYYYELAREYVGMGHQVTIVADVVGQPLSSMAKQLGADVITTDEVMNITPDICIGSHITIGILAHTFTCPIIQVIHSENDYLWEIEKPIGGVDHYIAVRETIRQRAIKEGIHPKKITTIWNPIDLSRFRPVGKQEKTLLFVGPADKLRRKVIKNLYAVARKKNLTVQLVGRGQPIEETVQIEKYINKCAMTASIYMGRTTLEGWAARKPGLIYEIDGEGEIISRVIVAPQDSSKYDSKAVAQRILELC